MKPDTRLIASALALLLLLAGCGQKGPLFLPEDADKAQTGLPSATPDGTSDDDTSDNGTKDSDTSDDDRTPPDEPPTDRDHRPPISPANSP